MPSDSPPSYTPSTISSYPQPHPSFRQRKSSTIISISSSGSDTSPTRSPTQTLKGLPSAMPSTSASTSTSIVEPASYRSESIPSLSRDSMISLRSDVSGSSPPSFHSGISMDEEEDYPQTPTHPAYDAHAHAQVHSIHHHAYPIPPGAVPPHLRADLGRSRKGSSDSSLADAEEGEATPLLAGQSEEFKGKWYEGPLFVTGVKLSVLFIIFTAVVVGTFWFGMPKVDPEDKPTLKLPKSFADLQALNALFQKYKNKYPFRILACGVVSYLFVQTFSLPGSMYISILFGAAYGMIYGLLLSCLCDSVGSIFCYTLSSLLAPPLLALPFYRARVETWRTKIMGDPKEGKQVSWDSVFAFLIVLRIAPFPPHWVANFVAPHLGIGPLMFWLSCFIGIAPVSVIHVTIGSSLDSMTSAADFHILSLRNVLGLCAVVVAVLIPVGLKRIFRKDLGELGEAEGVFEETAADESAIDVPPVHQVLEVDEHGVPRRFQAIDSGLVLAGPSRGDASIHPDLPAEDRKGKRRALDIIADVAEDDEGHIDQYEVFPHDERDIPAEKHRVHAPIRGYGSIEPVQPVSDRTEPGVLWPFAR